MKKLTLLLLVLVALTQAAFAIEEWQDKTSYDGGSKVTYHSLYYEAGYYAEPGQKPTDGGPWTVIDAPSPYPLIDADYTYYIGQGSKSITEDMALNIKDGTKPYTLVIIKEPTQGKVEVSGASFTYQPTKNLDETEEFTDSFEVKVKDSLGKESQNTSKIIIKLDDWKPEEYYKSRIESDIRSISMQNDQNCWLEYWKTQIAPVNIPSLNALKYYVRVNGTDEDKDFLSKITEEEGSNNPDNVNRVIRLMPKEKFVAMFPMATSKQEVNGFFPGKVFTYLNFLKAVAVMPGYCGNYKDDPSPYIKKQLENDSNFADKVAKKFLATTFAHAVQETSAGGSSQADNWRNSDSGFRSKLSDTFGHVREYFSGTPTEYADNGGPFSAEGHLHYLTLGNKYYGRGAKQLSYPANYANTSLLLYGDLRLVKYPNLVEKDILPFLTAITYTLIPKSKNPSIAEVMDGSWSHTWNTSQAPEHINKTYDRNFPLTVLIVNGGPECNGHIDIGDDQATTEAEKRSITSVANSKTRIDGYIFLSKSEDLLDPKVDISKDIVDKDEDHDYYKVDQLKINTINDGEHDYNQLFSMPYYYNQATDKVENWDSGIQIFGGQAVYDNMKLLSHPIKKIDKQDKNHKSFL